MGPEPEKQEVAGQFAGVDRCDEHGWHPRPSCPWCRALQEKERADKAEGALKACEAFAEELADRCEKAEARAEEAEAEVKRCHNSLTFTASESARMREALERVEWFEIGPHWGQQPCPWCKGQKDVGHAPDCPRQAALGRGDANG